MGTARSASAGGEPSGHGPAGDAIDRGYLARFTLGNAALEQEVLELFACHAPQYLEHLRAATSSQSWKEAAHTIKGSAAAVGARRLASLAEMAENLDIEGAQVRAEGDRERAVEAVAAAVDEACRYVARLFARS
ncbi:MAG: Hpt domain-containing protein [Hyphomicrobiaceae bacterium]|nr:MAG: Hpt domain-containing protein [Hyphomicrobiaceae bacterium]